MCAKEQSRPDRYEIDRFRLIFTNPEVEASYVKETTGRTLNLSRLTWVLLIVMVPIFALSDHYVFGEQAGTALLYRIIVVAFAIVILGLTWVPALAPFRYLSPGFFAVGAGVFCTSLVSLGDPAVFSPYIIGLFFAFAGIFVTAGVGYRSSAVALLFNLVIFEVVTGLVDPVTPEMFVTYNFFVPGIIMVHGYIVYLVGRTSRQSWARAAQLASSLAEVKTLSGLLPICASCKRVRDDEGYWKQIELFISERSEAKFSHGICEECSAELYPELAD